MFGESNNKVNSTAPEKKTSTEAKSGPKLLALHWDVLPHTEQRSQGWENSLWGKIVGCDENISLDTGELNTLSTMFERKSAVPVVSKSNSDSSVSSSDIKKKNLIPTVIDMSRYVIHIHII